jgi:hypothetical protein
MDLEVSIEYSYADFSTQLVEGASNSGLRAH